MKDWVRHIMPVLVVLPFGIHFLMIASLAQSGFKLRCAVIAVSWPSVVFLACAFFTAGVWSPPRMGGSVDDRTACLLEFGKEIDAIQSRDAKATFWGAGWFRHWDVQLVTHVTCFNILEPPDGILSGDRGEDYLIASDCFPQHFPEIEKILARQQKNPVFSNQFFRLYHLNIIPSIKAVPSASSTKTSLPQADRLTALNDRMEPSRSFDTRIPRFTWGPRWGTQEWVQYDFRETTTVSAAEVYWFDDSGGGECRVPDSRRLLYRDGNDWRPVDGTGEYATKKDVFNRVEFRAVKTTALRLEVRLQPKQLGGILEWVVE